MSQIRNKKVKSRRALALAAVLILVIAFVVIDLVVLSNLHGTPTKRKLTNMLQELPLPPRVRAAPEGATQISWYGEIGLSIGYREDLTYSQVREYYLTEVPKTGWLLYSDKYNGNSGDPKVHLVFERNEFCLSFLMRPGREDGKLFENKTWVSLQIEEEFDRCTAQSFTWAP